MARYSPGEWFAIITPGGVALLPPTVSAATVEGVWKELRAGHGLGAVIEGLVGAFGTSLSLLPDFAVLVDGGAGVRVAVRGGTTARLVAGGAAPIEITGAGVTTWSEQALGSVTSAVLAAPGATEGESLPIADGIVLAGRVEVQSFGDVSGAEGAAGTDQLREDPAEAGLRPDAPAATPGSDPASPEADAPATEPAAPAAETTWMEPAGDEADDFAELLFGRTVLSSVEAAAVREPAPELTEAAPPPVAAPVPAPQPSAPAGPPSFEPPAAPAAMIQGVPATAAAPQPAGDHDGETILVDDLRALISVGAPQLATPLTRTLPVLLVPGQDRLTLDRGAIVGTRPQLSRVQGSNVPQLVTVASPSGEISRNHLELRVEGTTVLAVDLNSTNGTLLLRAGNDPIRLHPGEASMLVAGDRIDLGDGVVLGFEGLT